PDRFVELLLEQPEPEQPKENKKPDRNPDAGEGAKAKKEEGKVGKKDAKMDKAKGNKVEIKKRELDKEIAENAGVLGALRDGAELDGVFGSSGLDANLTGGIGGLIGAKGVQMGAGGLGSRGSGLGGGGTASGLGGLGTKGRGSGSSGYGQGGGQFGSKGEGGIGSIGGDPIILGALDKSLIDAVIKRHMNQIRYCYQRELTKNPSLGGKVKIRFVIAKDGTVSKASAVSSTVGSAAVDSCIATRFMRFQFPEPKGGGLVIVTYPFIFAPG
ncbi:MAG: AgmX/PglI C-terminal domain-containing protein, partial [Myxococcota bacterium]|nr:AgmX/PglI C-terminal domain-containing protein [Myxococcota bacterium]